MMVAQKFASFLTSLRSIALSLLLIILFAWNFGSINTSAKDVLAMVPRIQQFEASGVKVVLHDEIKLKDSLAGMVDTELSQQERGATIDAVQKLTGSQVDRLFTIVDGQSHCDYTLATAKMRLYLNSDAALEDLQLVETKADPVGFEEEIARITAEGSDIGMPRSCYTMKLTQRGYNAKSALVGVIRQALN
jgi:hypothetical protein